MTVLAAFLILAGLIIFCGPCASACTTPDPVPTNVTKIKINNNPEINIKYNPEINIDTEITIKNI